MSMFLAPTPLNDAAPITELNTTPLIDVMLVLLVMLIITIPLQSHAVKLDLPVGVKPQREVNAVKNKLVITDTGALLWNGQAVNRPHLQALLTAAGQLDPEPELQLQPAPAAPYGPVDQVLVMTRRAQLTRLGFVGNEAYERF
jgi:biopolymer transport protein ExbD